MIIDKYYEKGYQAERHGKTIADDEYPWAQAEAQVSIYFAEDEMQQRIFDYGCSVGQTFATL